MEKGPSTMMSIKWEKDILLYDDQMGKGLATMIARTWLALFSDHSSAAPFPDPDNRSDRLGPAQGTVMSHSRERQPTLHGAPPMGT
ncbi:hypothetical protein CEXT_649061 [Caerostris extrusa]|uniref:Uncharacterized protein n=1 Tax=Caerostris extrusa TaxID=172846 RepID=A0AAV4WVA7_CAEEX|nr:hypothetical protein CEXT_649061 [Caerostris extrusa]